MVCRKRVIEITAITQYVMQVPWIGFQKKGWWIKLESAVQMKQSTVIFKIYLVHAVQSTCNKSAVGCKPV